MFTDANRQSDALFTADARFSVDRQAGKPVVLSGYALVWNSASEDRGGYSVKLAPSSATFATPTLALFNHQDGQILGSTANGTLRLTPDAHGVKFAVDLPDTSLGRDVAVLVERGDVTGMSFAMADPPWTYRGSGSARTLVPIAGRAEWAADEGGRRVLVASKFTVDEVSILARPAFRAASVGVQAEPPQYSGRVADSLRLERLRFDGVRLAA